MNANMPTSEVLNRAADLIEERGWVNGSGWNTSEHSSLCLEGGIMAAIGVSGAGSQPELWACPAYHAVAAYLERGEMDAHGGLPLNRALWGWNDAPHRTASEVVGVLRACAVIEASRERETAEVS